MLEEWLEDAGGFGDIDNGDLRRRIGRLRQAEHALENRGGEAEDVPVDMELLPIRGT